MDRLMIDGWMDKKERPISPDFEMVPVNFIVSISANVNAENGYHRG
jgi:hypothetical protein